MSDFEAAYERILPVPEGAAIVEFASSKLSHGYHQDSLPVAAAYDPGRHNYTAKRNLPEPALASVSVHEVKHAIQFTNLEIAANYFKFAMADDPEAFLADENVLFLCPSDQLMVTLLFERDAYATQIQVCMALAESGDPEPLETTLESFHLAPDTVKEIDAMVDRFMGENNDPMLRKACIRYLTATAVFDQLQAPGHDNLSTREFYIQNTRQMFDIIASRIESGALPPIPQEKFVRIVLGIEDKTQLPDYEDVLQQQLVEAMSALQGDRRPDANALSAAFLKMNRRQLLLTP